MRLRCHNYNFQMKNMPAVPRLYFQLKMRLRRNNCKKCACGTKNTISMYKNLDKIRISHPPRKLFSWIWTLNIFFSSTIWWFWSALCLLGIKLGPDVGRESVAWERLLSTIGIFHHEGTSYLKFDLRIEVTFKFCNVKICVLTFKLIMFLFLRWRPKAYYALKSWINTLN